MLALAEKIGDNGEVVRVAVDETSAFERAVRVALILTLLTNEEGAVKDLHFPKAKALVVGVEEGMGDEHLVEEVPLTLVTEGTYALGV